MSDPPDAPREGPPDRDGPPDREGPSGESIWGPPPPGPPPPGPPPGPPPRSGEPPPSPPRQPGYPTYPRPSPPAPGPPPPGSGAQPGYHESYPTGPYPSGTYPAQPERGWNVLAILTIVFAFVFAPAGIVLGHLARRQIRQTGEQGDTLANVGLILSYVFTGLGVIACCVGIIAAIVSGGNNHMGY